MFNSLLSAIGMVLGKLMMFIYNTIGFHNYVISLILFTIVTRLVLAPLNAKQIRSSQKMQELQPELQRLQERYKNDKEKLNEMTMKFYQEKGYNPTSGCLPMLIQLPIMFALYFVIRMPMTYMLEIPALGVGQMVVASVDQGDLNKNELKSKNYDAIVSDPYQVYKAFDQSDPYFEIKLIDSYKRHPVIIDENPTLKPEQKEVLRKFDITMFGFFNLGAMPNMNFGAVFKDPLKELPPWILLILSVVVTYLTTMLMMPKPQKDKNGKTTNAGCAGKSMAYISPIMTLWIGTIAPSGLVFYWTISSVLSYVQQKVMNKMYKKDKEENQVAKIDSKGSKNG